MISIIMPVYNAEKYVCRAIESVINQTYADWELIVVDDGSQDSTVFAVNCFKDSRIKLIRSYHQGVCATRNKGLDAAKGEFIAFLDVDDYLAPQMYTRLTSAAEGFDIAVCGYFIETGLTAEMLEIEEDNPYISYKFTHASPKEQQYNSDELATGIKNLLETNTLYPIWNKLFRRAIINEHNIRFDTSLLTWGDDELFNYDYLRYCNSVSCISDCVVYYSTADENALSYQFDDNRFNTELMLRERLLSLIKMKNGYGDEMKKQLAYVFCGKLLLHIDNLQKNNFKASQMEILSHWEDILLNDEVCSVFAYSGLASQFMGYLSRKYMLGTIISSTSFEELRRHSEFILKPSIITDLLFSVTCFLDEDERFKVFNRRAAANGAKWIIDPNGF